MIEDECKNLITMIDEPIKAIDSQIKAFDDMELQAKRAELEKCFNTENTLDFVILDDVLNPKWKNKTEKTESLMNEIRAKISGLKSDFEYLQNMYSDSGLWTAILKKFQETKSKEQTLAYAVELERSEKRLNTSKINSTESNIIIPETNQTPIKINSESNRIVSGTFKVTCTESQLIALRDFMKSKNIKFELVK